MKKRSLLIASAALCYSMRAANAQSRRSPTKLFRDFYHGQPRAEIQSLSGVTLVEGEESSFTKSDTFLDHSCDLVFGLKPYGLQQVTIGYDYRGNEDLYSRMQLSLAQQQLMPCRVQCGTEEVDIVAEMYQSRLDVMMAEADRLERKGLSIGDLIVSFVPRDVFRKSPSARNAAQMLSTISPEYRAAVITVTGEENLLLVTFMSPGSMREAAAQGTPRERF